MGYLAPEFLVVKGTITPNDSLKAENWYGGIEVYLHLLEIVSYGL
jgi:hypothetical protein